MNRVGWNFKIMLAQKTNSCNKYFVSYSVRCRWMPYKSHGHESIDSKIRLSIPYGTTYVCTQRKLTAVSGTQSVKKGPVDSERCYSYRSRDEEDCSLKPGQRAGTRSSMAHNVPVANGSPFRVINRGAISLKSSCADEKDVKNPGTIRECAAMERIK